MKDTEKKKITIWDKSYVNLITYTIVIFSFVLEIWKIFHLEPNKYIFYFLTLYLTGNRNWIIYLLIKYAFKFSTRFQYFHNFFQFCNLI